MGRKRDVEEAAIPLSAMIDVVFLLLIYFIVTQKPIVNDVFLAANLPNNDTTPPKSEPKPPFKIDVIEGRGPDAESQYRMDGRVLTYRELESRLSSPSINPAKIDVIIMVDPNGTHKKLVNLLDMLQKLNFTSLNLVDDYSVPFKDKKKP